ncbi:MAG: hypothetical protein LBQ70_05145 [Prevotellaceae bacterium]|jgi:hypothetical protein|nr:hypothetical protein [Prevotellaceae bacterium]
MNENKFLKFFAISAFIVLMFVSCWATTESLHLLLPSWPVVFFWAISIIFFVVASLGTKMIVDSFNQNIQLENRGWRLLGGVLLLVVFWIVFSLPTNTHTFFYRSVIKDVLIKELQDTKDKLQDLASDGEAGKIIAQEKADFRNKTDALFAKFSAEINNPGIPGWGDRAENALIDMEAELGKIQRLKLRSNSLSDRQELIKTMREQVDNLLESKLASVYDTRLANINRGLDKDEIQRLIGEISKTQNKIAAMPVDNDEPTQLTRNNLTQAFAIINKYCDVLKTEFENTHPNVAEEAEKVLKEYDLPKIVKLESVIVVWTDFFAGRYAGRGFLFWIIIAALVDIAGFIFFDMAFKRVD